MKELMINNMGYENFDVMLQDEGMKKVIWSIWNQLSITRVEARESKAQCDNNALDIENIKQEQDEYNNRLEKAEDFAECLYNNSSAKKDFNNHVNSLAYRFTGGSSEIKDCLFHGIITKNIKAYVCKELNATCEGRIKVVDLETAKKLARSYLTPFEVNRLITKTIDKWQSQIEKGSVRKTLDVSMLNKYIDLENEKMAKNMEEKLNAI